MDRLSISIQVSVGLEFSGGMDISAVAARREHVIFVSMGREINSTAEIVYSRIRVGHLNRVVQSMRMEGVQV